LIGSVIIVLVSALLSGCGINPIPVEGVVSGEGSITLNISEISPEEYAFFYGKHYYGSLYFYYHVTYPEVSAPYGIYVSNVDLDSAPASGYTLDNVFVEIGEYYFFRPDSIHYGRFYLNNMSSTDTTTSIDFDWILQTNDRDRGFY